MKRPNPLSPALMTPAERRTELCRLLAPGSRGGQAFPAACSDGNDPRVLIALRITRFRLSTAFVVQITFRISGLKAKNGITSSQARRHA